MDLDNLKDVYKDAVDYSLMNSLAMQALLGNFDEFSLEEIRDYIFSKLPDSHKDIIPTAMVNKNHQRVLDMGVTHGIFVTTSKGKYKLTESGKDIASIYFIETGCLCTDVARN